MENIMYSNNGHAFSFNGHNIGTNYNSYTSALLYSDVNETIATYINKQFTVSSVSSYPYLAVEFDWKINQVNNAWAYNRNCCGIATREHFGYGRLYQAICNINQSTSSLNSAITAKKDSVFCCLGLNTSLTSYSNLKYIWCNNSTGFSAICDNIWRYKDARTNNITALKNFTCSNEVTTTLGSRIFYLKNLKVAGFNSLENAMEEW